MGLAEVGPWELSEDQWISLGYMQYQGDLVRASLLNYLYEVDTKFDDCGMTFNELGAKYNPKVIIAKT